MGNPLSTGISGLLAAQRAIATTSHNIANANTEGYTRQRVINSTRPAELRTNGYVGNGVKTAYIERVQNQFAEQNLRSTGTELKRTETFSRFARRIDDLFGNESSNLNTAQARFFNAISEAETTPNSIPARQGVVLAAEGLADRFNFLNNQLSSLQREVNQSVDASVNTMNKIATDIASLNERISVASSKGVTAVPHDLIDRRDQLLKDLSDYTSLSITPMQDNSLSVYMGNGILLISESTALELTTGPSSEVPGQTGIALRGMHSDVPVTDKITGGSLGGLMDFNREMLNPVRNELGLLATTLAHHVNNQHALGTNPQGHVGENIFQLTPIKSVAGPDNQGDGNIDVSIVDATAIQASDYRIHFDGTELSITRLTDMQLVNAPVGTIVDGVQFDVSGTLKAGDEFIVRPTASAAAQFTSVLKDPANLALAANATDALGVTGNRLSELQNTAIFANASNTFSEQYASLITEIGGVTQAGSIQLQSMQEIWQHAANTHDNTAGVNLDEEAVNLMKYQQAYDASAQVITVAGRMFDTLLGTINRI